MVVISVVASKLGDKFQHLIVQIQGRIPHKATVNPPMQGHEPCYEKKGEPSRWENGGDRAHADKKAQVLTSGDNRAHADNLRANLCEASR
jgi:hypothetical protein